MSHLLSQLNVCLLEHARDHHRLPEEPEAEAKGHEAYVSDGDDRELVGRNVQPGEYGDDQVDDDEADDDDNEDPIITRRCGHGTAAALALFGAAVWHVANVN